MRQVALIAMALLIVPCDQADAALRNDGQELPVANETEANAPPLAPVLAPLAPPLNTNYRISGTKALRPSRISDDGLHTYIEWSEDQALPAVFAVSAVGGEEMVDGYMREGIFTIDRVNRELVFRIDKKWAKAERLNGNPDGGK